MSLLPNNSTQKDQAFAELLDKKSSIHYDDLKIDVMTCDVSVLPHIALTKGANIEGMLEHEARAYLKTFTKKYIGTIGAVEDAINACFSDAELTEWFENDSLEVGEFDISVNVKNDLSLVYGKRLFSLSKRLINDSKNVRSKLNSFELKIKSAGNIGFEAASVQDISLKNYYNYKEKSDLDIQLQTASISDVKLSKDIESYQAKGKFETSIGAVAIVNLENDSEQKQNSNIDLSLQAQTISDVNLTNNPIQNQKTELNLNLKTGGVTNINMNMNNEFNFKNKNDVNLIIAGGVAWQF